MNNFDYIFDLSRTEIEPEPAKVETFTPAPVTPEEVKATLEKLRSEEEHKMMYEGGLRQ